MTTSELDEDGFPPVQEGYTRIFMDHTGRWYKDFSPEEMEEYRNDPLMKEINRVVTEQIDKELIQQILDTYRGMAEEK